MKTQGNTNNTPQVPDVSLPEHHVVSGPAVLGSVRASTAAGVRAELSPESREIPRQRFALHEIDVQALDDGPLDAEAVRDPRRCRIVTRNPDHGEFDEKDYSRMKYGCGTVAATLGARLVDAYIREHLEELSVIDPSDVVVTSSAYKVAPTASHAVMHAALARLNEFFLSLGKGPAHPLQISRLTLAQGDYGTLTQEQREERMRANRLYADASQVRGKHVIVVDDACITGAHERNVMELLSPHAPASIRFLYLAEFADAAGGKFSKVEDRINHADVSSPQAVAELMLRHDFILNDRVCKFFLSRRVPLDELQTVLEDIIDHGGGSRVSLLQRYCLGNGYAVMPEYAERYRIIEAALQARGLWRPGPWSERAD